MMKNLLRLSIVLLISLLAGLNVKAQNVTPKVTSLDAAQPWTAQQLIEPAELVAAMHGDKAHEPVILNIGAVEDIKDAQHIGPVSQEANLARLKEVVKHLPKNAALVIYCGCCPFAKCPNIRPAFAELKQQGFTQVKVLDLPVNLKTNWIAKGYPLAANVQ
jgi:hypothetical protein